MSVYDLAKRAGAGPHMLKWSKSYGTGLRRAWRECPDGLWLLMLAEAAGVSQRRLKTANRAWWSAIRGRTAEAAAVRKAIRWAVVAKSLGRRVRPA